jgi:hypothetical protein
MSPRRFAAVIDTNVLLDIYSIADLEKAYGAAAGAETDETHFRRVRARESLVFAWLLHQRAATTISLPFEPSRMLVRDAPPDARDTLQTQHVQLSIYVVKDYVLDSWDHRSVRGADKNLTGERCDDLLLALAREERAPLVTNEGYSLSGVSSATPRGLRAKGLRAGVRVLTPRDFWSGAISDGRACRQFLARFDSETPKYLAGKGHPKEHTNAVNLRRGILRHLFFGETSDGPVLRVRHPLAG